MLVNCLICTYTTIVFSDNLKLNQLFCLERVAKDGSGKQFSGVLCCDLFYLLMLFTTQKRCVFVIDMNVSGLTTRLVFNFFYSKINKVMDHCLLKQVVEINELNVTLLCITFQCFIILNVVKSLFIILNSSYLVQTHLDPTVRMVACK